MLRNAVYVAIILFLVVASFAAYTVYAGARQASQAVEPIGDLFRQLVVPVTPVILPNSSTIVHEINNLARLETASYELEKVVTADSNTDAFWGLLGESLIFVAYGKVYAGVDLAEMGVEDLQVTGPETVVVKLPPARIFEDIPMLDNDRSYVADRDTGLLTRSDPQLETQVRQAAEDAILEAALASDILDIADENAQRYMESFLNGLGFENVIFSEVVPPTPPPYVQEVPKGFVVTPAAP